MHSSNNNLSPVEFEKKCYEKKWMLSLLYSEYDIGLTDQSVNGGTFRSILVPPLDTFFYSFLAVILKRTF